MSLRTKLKNLQLPKSVYLAVFGILLCIFYLVFTQFKSEELIPVREPSVSPYQETISGLGIIEAQDKNVKVAPFYAGIVKRVLVKEGDLVEKGTVLYQLDTDVLKAQLLSQEAIVNSLRTNLAKLKLGTRPEDLPLFEAEVKQKKAKYANLSQYISRLKKVPDQRAISQNELTQKEFELAEIKAKLEKANANLNKAKTGTWGFDIKQAEFEYQSAVNKKKEIQTKIQQASIKSPVEALVLQVNINPGEYVLPSKQLGSVVIGKNQKLQVRVDIDEINASLVKENMEALAFVKGHPNLKFSLEFVRIEPYMVPKKNLSGNPGERTDTRVLQVIYQFSPPEFPVYIGQQVEVYLKKTQLNQKIEK